MIDRYLLRYLLAVVDKGSFTRAAAHCGVSQPTLSAGIAKLEYEVGVALLLRSNRRVELTGAGARLVERARRIEREFTMAEQETQPAGLATSLRVGVVSSLPSAWIQAAMRAAIDAPGHHRIEMVEASEKSLLTQLDRGRLDVLLSIVRANRAHFAEPIYEEGYGLVLPIEHRLAGRTVVDPEEVAENPMIVRRHCEVLVETSRHFTSRGVRPFMSARTDSDDHALAYVRAGHGLTVMPLCFADHGIAMAHLSGFDFSRTIGFIHDTVPGERHRSAALEAMRETILRCHAPSGERHMEPAWAAGELESQA